MIKKPVIVLAALMLLSSAYAETAAIGSTGMTIELPDGFEQYTLADEDLEVGLKAHYGCENPEIEVYIHEYENDDWSIEELADALEEEEGTQSTGLTDINGIRAAYRVFKDGDIACVDYEIIDGDWIESLVFCAGSDEAKQKSMDIMNTLKG